MIVLFIILAIVTFFGVRFSDFHKDYMSLSSANAIKGVFAVIILFSHLSGYIELKDSFCNRSFEIVLSHIGQLMVAMYLFYSGYGIIESYKHKPEYIKSFPKRRLFKTLIHFDIAVFFFLLLNIVIGPKYPLENYITCWLGWESIGNSNWFICVILLLYVLTYLSCIVVRKTNVSNDMEYKVICIIASALCLGLWAFLVFAKKGTWWYDTIATFPIGMWFSVYQRNIDSILRRKVFSMLLLFASIGFLLLWHCSVGNDRLGICASIFCITLALFTSKVHMDNKMLQWLGKHSFALYIMQRLPMNLFSFWGWNCNPGVFTVVSILSVLFVAWLYNALIQSFDVKFGLG